VKEELQFHLRMQVEENIRRGLDPRDAHRKLGNMTQASEEVYRMNTIAFLDEAAQNVRFSLRTMRRNPGFALTAVLVLALGLDAALPIGPRRHRPNHRSERQTDSRDRRSARRFRDAGRRNRYPSGLPDQNFGPRLPYGIWPPEARHHSGTGPSRHRTHH